MTKAQFIKIIADTAAPHKLSREEKFQVLVNVCDNAFHAGQITKAQHTRWTNVF
jgi:hypothetical protein